MTGPGDETGTPAAAGRGRMRASHADREHVVDALKAAFVQGRLTQDELDERVGQALAARTYADLAALTADLPAEPHRSPAPAPGLAETQAPRSRNAAAHKAVKVGACVIGGAVVLVSGTAFAIGQPVAAVALAVFMVMLTVAAGAVVASLIAVALKLEARHGKRTRRQFPPGPAPRAPIQAPKPPKPPKPPQARRHPPGSLAIGRAG